MMLGTIIKCLQTTGLDPENHVSNKSRSAVDISDLLHGLKDSIFSFVRHNCCQTAPPVPSTGFGMSSHYRESAFCAVHGDENMCPGATFHVECNFLPQMLREVNMIFDGVAGLSLDDFVSRKVFQRGLCRPFDDEEL